MLLLIVIFSSSLSGLAVYQLHRISDYVHLYQISKKFCCFQTQPIVHRSLLFRLAEKDENHEQLKEFLDASTPDMVNRMRRGETALHISVRCGSHKCTIKLLQSRSKAEIKHNKSGEFPDLLQNIDVINKLDHSNLSPQLFWKLAYQKLPSETFWKLAWQKNLDIESRELEESINQLIKRIKISPKKCGFVGDGAVGKSCLIITQATSQFPPGYSPGLDRPDRTDVPFLQLQDSQGQEEFESMRRLFLLDVDLLIVCFSLISQDSFENVRSKWSKEISKYLRTNTPIMLVGTKMDLRDDRVEVANLKAKGKLPITTEQGESMAKELKAVKYMECSASTKVGLQEVFDEIFKIAHGLDQVTDGTRWSQERGTIGRWRHRNRNADLGKH